MGLVRCRACCQDGQTVSEHGCGGFYDPARRPVACPVSGLTPPPYQDVEQMQVLLAEQEILRRGLAPQDARATFDKAKQDTAAMIRT